MTKFRNFCNTMHFRAMLAMENGIQRMRSKLAEKNGSFFTEHALAIVITVVIAAILIAIVVALIKNKISPQLDNKVNDFFNMT